MKGSVIWRRLSHRVDGRLQHRVMRVALILMMQVPLLLQGQVVFAEGELSTLLLPEEQETNLALEAGPEQIRGQATVYVFRSKGYEKVRNGANGFTCLVNRDGNQRGDNDLKPTCWDPEGSRTIVPVMLRVGELIAARASAEEIKRDIDAGFSDGRFSSPRRTGIAYMLKGDLQYDPKAGRIVNTRFPPHYMLYAPGVTNKDIGTNLKPSGDGPALPSVYSGYSGGSHTSYIIVLAMTDRSHSH